MKIEPFFICIFSVLLQSALRVANKHERFMHNLQWLREHAWTAAPLGPVVMAATAAMAVDVAEALAKCGKLRGGPAPRDRN